MHLEHMTFGSDYSDVLLELESGSKYDLDARELKFDSKNNTVTFYIEVFESDFFTELTNNKFSVGTWKTIKNIKKVQIDDAFFVSCAKDCFSSAGSAVGIVELYKQDLLDIAWQLTSVDSGFIMEFKIKAHHPIEMRRVAFPQ